MAELIAISPSRANDFLQCPLKYRFRTIDRLPEPPSLATFTGTLVHAVLEDLFDHPAASRTPQTAKADVPGALAKLREKRGAELDELIPGPEDEAKLLARAGELLDSYFTLELPNNLEPAAREEFVEVTLDNGLRLRGFIDRKDVAPGGEVRLVDYKTGKKPKPQYGREADLQMRCYALMHYRATGEVVHTLQLYYLGSGQTTVMNPTLEIIERTEAELLSIWDDIARAAVTGEWRPRKSPLCGWCHFKPLCPAWGGTPPEAPEITAIAGRTSEQS